MSTHMVAQAVADTRTHDEGRPYGLSETAAKLYYIVCIGRILLDAWPANPEAVAGGFEQMAVHFDGYTLPSWLLSIEGRKPCREAAADSAFEAFMEAQDDRDASN